MKTHGGTAQYLSDETPEPMPTLVWLTTQEVVERYGFNPSGYATDCGGGTVKSKLRIVHLGSYDAITQERVWLLDSVESKAAEIAAADAARATQPKITSAWMRHGQ